MAGSTHGETSWDFQSFFAGPVGGRAKALYYRHRLIGTAAVAPMIFCEAFLPSARRLFHHPTAIPDCGCSLCDGFCFPLRGDRRFFPTGKRGSFSNRTRKIALSPVQRILLGISVRLGLAWGHDQATDAADHHDALRVRSVSSGLQSRLQRPTKTSWKLDPCTIRSRAPCRCRHQGFQNIGNGQQLFLYSFR